MLTITKVIGVFFSTTGNAEQIVLESGEYIAHNLGVPFESENFTKHDEQRDVLTFSEGDLVIFGTPIYAGRISNKILSLVKNMFQGNGAFALPMVVFGDRRFDNSLVDLASELKKNNFNILAAGACACAYDFSEMNLDRPNTDDRKHREAFCATVVDKTFAATMPLDDLEIKGNTGVTGSYLSVADSGEQAAPIFKAQPVSLEKKADSSGVGASLFPMGSIKKADTVAGSFVKNNNDAQSVLSHTEMPGQTNTMPVISEFFL